MNQDPVLSVRSRYHSCSPTIDEQGKTCQAPRCAFWSGWASWGSCSTSCGTGMATRRRTCIGSQTLCARLIGTAEEMRSCFGGTGQDYYSSWSPCSVSCGTGVKTRSIQNTCSSSSTTETEVCTNNMGSYSLWSDWSGCSASCGGGVQQRHKTHSCGLDSYIQERSCNENPGAFGPWSEWSGCDVSCGGGRMSRNRVHSCTGEVEVASSFCNTHPCAYYGAWSNWSPCSTSCGIGTMNRMRYCHGGAVGDGLCLSGDVTTSETASCDMGDCCDFDWSGWTGCCRDTENRNVRLRFRGGCDGSSMDQLAKPCNTQNPVQDTCLVVIQNAYAMGIINSPVVNTNVINPDEHQNFQNSVLKGRTLGHTDKNAYAHKLSTPVRKPVNPFFHGQHFG